MSGDSPAFGPLVSTAWLAERLGAASVLDGSGRAVAAADDVAVPSGEPGADVRVVDCRWYLKPFDMRDPDVEYARGHIPGAVHLRWDVHWADAGHPIPGMLAQPEAFAETMAAAGIGDRTTVVAYDDGHVTVAARLWWALRVYGHEAVAVLDGGIDRWVAEGRPLGTEVPAWPRGDFTARPRSAAYATRYVAKNIVAAGLADRCEIQIAYAIGTANPVSIMVDTFGTGNVTADDLVALIREHFDLRPAAIIRDLDLRRPIYRQTAAYGHFGRADIDAPWEATDKAELLRSAAG